MKPELIIAIIAGVFAVISALFAYVAQVSAAKSQREIAVARQTHERQRPFLDAQIKYYVEATETAATIPRVADNVARSELVARFWQLYWGCLAMVEDNEVAQAMIAYGEMLEKNPTNASALEGLSLGIAHACRESLKRLWVPGLGDITHIRPASV